VANKEDNSTIPFRQVKPEQNFILPLNDFFKNSDLTLEREGDNCRLSMVVSLETLEAFACVLGDLVAPEARRAEVEKAKKRKANSAAAQKSRKKRDLENTKIGKTVYEAVEIYCVDGADLRDARRVVADELDKSVEEIEFFDVLYRKKNNVERIKRDARIMRLYRAGHSNAEIGKREGMHEKSVARLVGKYRREKPSVLEGKL